jgi:ABC-type sulfate transport system permease component
MPKGCKVVGGWTILALTLLGVCLYAILSFLTYDWLYQLVPQNIGTWPLDTHEFIQQAISNTTVLSRYFLTAFVFIFLGVVVGLLVSWEYARYPKNAARIVAERANTLTST